MSEPREEIMEATFRALCKHGYADLSIQRIADESDKGKSLIYYHFDDKEDLMLSFMDHMAEKIEEDHEERGEMPPEERFDRLLDMALGIESEEQWKFQKAYHEFRAQSQHNEKFAEKFREIDDRMVENLTKLMKDVGADDPETAADIFLSLIDGAVGRKVSANDREGLEELKEDIKDVVSSAVLGECSAPDGKCI